MKFPKSILTIPLLLCPSLLPAQPGDVVSFVAPDLREPARAMHAVRGPDDALYLWGEFHTAGDTESGGVVKLTAEGAVSEVLAETLLPPQTGPAFLPPTVQAPPGFPHSLWVLVDGRVMLWRTGHSGVLIDVDGNARPGFFADLPTEIAHLVPQFERDGHFYFVVSESDGNRYVARQPLSAEEWTPAVLSSADWPLPPASVIPAGDGGLFVLGREQMGSTAGGGIGWPFFVQFAHRVFAVDADGALVPDIPVVETGLYRHVSLEPSGDGYRLLLWPDSSPWQYWPQPTFGVFTVEWRDENSALQRSMDFQVPLFVGVRIEGAQRFAFAEGTDGSVLATGPDGLLRRRFADGTPDTDFTSPGRVNAVLPMADDRWLLDGTRRILPNGEADPEWIRPDLERPARVTRLASAPDGGFMSAGRFYRADGAVANRLARWRADGSLDDGFSADSRLPDLVALAVRPDGAILAATADPVTLPGGGRTDVVRLEPDGGLDKTFVPELDVPYPRTQHIAAQPDGGVLVLRQHPPMDVAYQRLIRLLPDGTQDEAFPGLKSYRWIAPEDLLVLSDGSYFLHGALFDSRGEKLLTVGGDEDGTGFRPLGEMPDGSVIFSERRSVTTAAATFRLRRWNEEWDESFAANIHADSSLRVLPSSDGKLYVWSDSLRGEVAETPGLVRLHRNGRIDPTFRAPELEHWPRRGPGPWETFTVGGMQSVDPADWAEGGSISSLWLDEANERLWIAGDFNLANGLPRDGLVAVQAYSATGYEAWSQSALRDASGERGPDADANGDGRLNLAAYVTGGDPLARHSGEGLLRPLPGESPTFGIWLNPEAADVGHTIKTSEDLKIWRPATEDEITVHSAADRLIFSLNPQSQARFTRVHFSIQSP